MLRMLVVAGVYLALSYKVNNSIQILFMLLIRKALLALSLLVVGTTAFAAPIMLDGNHFTVAYDDASAGIYGAGAMSGPGDTVFFVPSAFTAFSGVAGGAASTHATLQLSFIADPGYVFTGLAFTERGDYLLFGGGSVNVGASIEAENTATAASTVFNLSPAVPLVLLGAPTHNWDLTGDFSLLGLGALQTLQITLDNSLFASTPTAGAGFIEKKFVGFRLLTEAALPPGAVPEPASWALLLIGMMAALLVGGRRRVRVSGVDRGL
jgi:hypothetical protein